MNTHSLIPHRMFVAAASGARRVPPRSSPPVHVLIEPMTPSGADLDEKRRSEAVSAIGLRQVFELGARFGV